jgi:hypothetical protein
MLPKNAGGKEGGGTPESYCVQAKFSRTLRDVNAEPLKRNPSAPTPKPVVMNSAIPRLPAEVGHESGTENAM